LFKVGGCALKATGSLSLSTFVLCLPFSSLLPLAIHLNHLAAYKRSLGPFPLHIYAHSRL